MSTHIKEYWEKKAAEFPASHSASWSDIYAIKLEIETIGNYIKNGANVLDAGCANGYSMIRQLKKKQCNITGIDFSANMIEAAKINLKNEGLNDSTDFFEADIRNLPFENDQFDLVYTTRVLINLPTWPEQIKGILECLRVAKKGGTVIFSEAFWEPLMLLNTLRNALSLRPLEEHDFNRYLKIDKMTNFFREKKLDFHIEDFSSIYYLGSRLLREILPNQDELKKFDNELNSSFYDLERQYSGGGLGIQQAFVLQSK